MRPLKTAGMPFNCLLLLAVTLSTSLSDQTRADPNEDWYQVELIVFSQQDLYQDEQHPTNIRLQYPENWQRLENDTSTSADNPQPAEQLLIRLEKEDFSLGPDEYTLNRAAGYRVLTHMAWRQPGLGQAQSPWIIVSGGHRHGNHHELEGSIRLVVTRYLHIQADLWKTSFATTAGTGTASPGNPDRPDSWPQLPVKPWLAALPVPGDASPAAAIDTSSPVDRRHPPVKKIIVLNQSEQVDLNKLTYLDHPEMGVLVLVTRHTSAAAD
ncbi:CsiV family protein [uncultured Porticoccus sp.]|uniref:CsiV family protein n=1 Tax=uncultured Porticoccus sp. TaxID=1256050 RepID=UPI0026376D2E|nr:CsiV family protein [uncultured Porticoccus sp.]